MKLYYPLMLDLKARKCLIVGGGLVAERKIGSLLVAGAAITVVSPDFTAAIEAKGSSGELVLHRRIYDSEDIQGFSLVIAATDLAHVNKQIAQDASKEGIWVNVVDQPELSSFIVPSVVRRGKLTLSVSTGGASPGTARRIAAELESAYGQEYEIYLDFLSEMRLKVQDTVKDRQSRQTIFKQMLDWDVLEKIRNGTFTAWRQEKLDSFEQDST
ncbi:precorrin-2 dehydrogenase/sirohydrochlorin ferrochelatase family protein [Paenibacillus eucommiae]|uniref:precorrin-2 dehydrogenase n=1 Tax=Paenibacillus eucommiae TaxID=1355755 RepID=A0ABS4J7X8_9BACL|nr:bifunctional precorrin-2 dehydrogenase/sirohydrochlorin ferrochelatase [Paenibacillus eucommiae]MBP1995942.1 precorrin-2 dehydrogenase/sirohydrochlorin ferrochelatase [Paenibacillus eucommiae]